MKTLQIGGIMAASAVSLGCMRMDEFDMRDEARVDAIMDAALGNGINYFDHADIYGGGRSETLFGTYLARHPGIRDRIYIQTKCAIHDGQYDFSKEHILSSVEGSLRRLRVDYVDVLLLHRPDTLMEPEEVAEAFDTLHSSGKVRHFGVSNHNPMQMELLKTAVKHPLIINQLQFSATEAGMVTSGMNANMKNGDSVMHDGSVLEYSRIKNITIQAWSPFQHGFFKGTFIDNEDFPELNAVLAEIGEKYGLSKTGVAAAWILRHPAGMQVIAGTMNPNRLGEICKAADVTLTRAEWYRIYCAAGHCLP
ncbi:MAG: aldo/keto reductase family oxidoreductase [Ruminococcaceae bacterium]|nr:aldo/keto reductase family oxidoreductase [Oscillospiraceae bacterium]